MPGTITASLPDASAEPCTLVPLYENSTRTGYEFEFLKRATRELPKLSYETVTPPILFCPVTTATCNTNMKTETKKMYRPVLWRMVIALSTTTDCLCQYRNRPWDGKPNAVSFSSARASGPRRDHSSSPNNCSTSGIVVNAPTATSVQPIARLCSAVSFSESNSAMPAPSIARVPAMRPI